MPVLAESKPFAAALLQKEILAKLLQDTSIKRASGGQQAIVQIRQVAPRFIEAFCNVKCPMLVVSAKPITEGVPTKVIEVAPGKTEVLEVTGNPLESPFSLEEELMKFQLNEPEEIHSEKFCPLNSSFARTIQMNYAMKVHDISKPHPEGLCPVCFIMDAGDGQKLTLMVTEAPSRNRIFASRELCVSEDRLEDLRRSAMEQCAHHAFLKLDSNTNLQVLRVMEHGPVVGQSLDGVVNQLGTPENLIYRLRTAWNTSPRDLDVVPSLSALCTLEVLISTEYLQWRMDSLVTETVFLNGLVSLLRNKDLSMETCLPSLNGAQPLEDLELFQLVTDVLTNSKPSLMTSQEFEGNSEDSKADFQLDSFVEQVVAMMRPNRDVTDLFWSTFKRCQTVRQLANCLKLVLQQSVEIQPFVQSSNFTSLGSLLKDYASIRTQKGLMDSLEAVQLLLESGYNKLVRDISYICDRSGLQLGKCSPKISEDMPKWDLDTWSTHLSTLRHFMVCMELVLRLKRELHPNKEALNKILNQALSSKTRVLKLNFLASHFASFTHCTRPSLSSWNFSVVTKTGVKSSSHFACSTQTPFFPWVPAAGDDEKFDIPMTDFSSTLADGSIVLKPDSHKAFFSTMHSIKNP